jgi:hypothetical protein
MHLISSSHPRLCIFTSDFPTNILYVFISSMRFTCHAHLILPDLVKSTNYEGSPLLVCKQRLKLFLLNVTAGNLRFTELNELKRPNTNTIL